MHRQKRECQKNSLVLLFFKLLYRQKWQLSQKKIRPFFCHRHLTKTILI